MGNSETVFIPLLHKPSNVIGKPPDDPKTVDILSVISFSYLSNPKDKNMSESKINVKIGIIEFSGEGDQKWLSEQFDKILEKMPELLKIEISNPSNGSNNGADNGKTNSNGTVTGLSIINIAGKLNCKSGSDLVIAAAAFLHFIENKTTFSRDDITQTMKKATGYYKNSHLANLTTILAGLEKNSTLTKTATAYSLQIDKVNELNAVLSK